MLGQFLLAAAISIAPSSEPSSRLADAVAGLRASGGGEIVLLDGVHYLDAPLKLTAADSNIVLRAAEGAHPVLSAGRRIRGWRIGKDGAWRVHLDGTNRFSQLYVNGQRRERPFLPRRGYFRVSEAGPQENAERFHAKFGYPDGALNHYWPDLDQVEIRVFHNWSNTRMRIKEIDPIKHVVTLAGLSPKNCADNAFTSRFWFRAENVRAAFGEPGDWYLTPEHELWYMPMPGETPENTEVVASCCNRVVEIDGSVRIGFVGLTFSHADETLAGDGRYYGQAGFFLPGAVCAINARKLRFKDCAFTHHGSFGLVFAENCHDCKATACEFYDLGAGGVRIGNGSFDKVHPPDASTCVVEDCHLAHGGRVDPVAAAIWIGNASSNRVSNCTIEDFYYSGISCGWDWGFANRRSHHNVLENCHIFDIGQGVLSDLGGIYTLAQQPGTVIRGNYIHDVTRAIYMGAGIYFDECSSFITVSNNYVTAVQDECLFHHDTRSNVVVRNVFRPTVRGSRVFGAGLNAASRPSCVTDNIYELAARDSGLGAEFPGKGWVVSNNVACVVPPPPRTGRISPDRFYAALPPVPKVFTAGPGPAYPERPFAENFETSEVSRVCANLVPWPKDEKHTFVTDETAGEGTRSYKMVDGLKPNFAPHICKSVNRSRGKVRVSFALRVEPGSAPFFQLRADPFREDPRGPALRIDGSGAVRTTRGKVLTKLEHGRWHYLAVEFVLGKERKDAVYTVEITGSDGKRQVFPGNPYDEAFERMVWFGFISDGPKDTVYYLDDIRVSDPPADDSAGEVVSVAADFDKAIGKVRRELHSSGFGPQICSCPPQAIADIRSMGFKSSRTHDWALINPGQRVCDYYHIFPLMNKDATDPENYVFGPTDYLLKRTREEVGHDVFFRLGTSIEHSGKKVHFNAAIPTDFDKMAEIFAGTVRHYNRGWANGFNWDIRYWEIWNEPDGTINMWCLPEGDLAENGDKAEQARLDEKRSELFIRFYVKVLKRLKDEFGETIRVGGPAMCWMDRRYFRALLGACREAGVAPDFISWHHYAEDPMVVADAVRTGRALCDEYGFTKCELIVDEWHYFSFSDYDWGDLRSPEPEKMRICWEGPRSHNGIDSSCFNLVVLSQMQTSALDQGYYYGCRNTGSWGFKDEFQRKYKVYYGLKMFGDLLKDSSELYATTVPAANGSPAVSALATKSPDGRRKSLLIVDYRTRASAVQVKVAGVSAKARVRAFVHDKRRDLEQVEASFVDGLLKLAKSDSDSAAFLIRFEE